MNDSYSKFLVDAGVSQLVERYLRECGCDILAVRDINPQMPDEDIIALAYKEKRIIITMDKDFGELVYHSLLPHAGVLLLRLDDANGADKVRIIAKILKEYSHQLSGSFAVYQNDKFRIRKIQN